MGDSICYHSGEYINKSEALVGLDDAVWFEGAVYEFCRTYNHVPYFWEEHIDRLIRSARAVNIKMGLTAKQIYDISLEVYNRNSENLAAEDDLLIITRVTRGTASAGPTIIIYAANLIPIYKEQAKYYQEGIHLVVASTRQIPPQCLDPKIKSTNRYCNSLGDMEAKMDDPEAFGLLLDIYGFATECTRYNFFIVQNGELITSKTTNCLQGITRATILKLAEEEKVPHAEKEVGVYDFYNADEIFITANSFTMYPVRKFNYMDLDGQIPGPVTQQLEAAFSRKVGVDIVKRVVDYKG